jgi:hypothetical protein
MAAVLVVERVLFPAQPDVRFPLAFSVCSTRIALCGKTGKASRIDKTAKFGFLTEDNGNTSAR